ncbi:AEC family transporter [Nitrincola alkalilacustris]|uniref:AEC family transporter n=1 Tax=Nitrincola alkalilacustris TaxID=1571224 RepID=UPI00124C4410|nr:AEC family transporter [Nitrincola alkalilacustris]
MDLYLETFGFTANIVTPIFFIVFLGYLLRRLKVIDESFIAVGSKLVFTITLPALVFMSIAQMDFQAVFNPGQLTYVVIGTLLTYGIIWFLAARWIKDPKDLGVFVQGAFRSNFGIIGLAVSFNLFGQSGLAQASLLLALVIPLYNVMAIVCIMLPLSKERSLNLASAGIEILKNPLIIAVVLALPVSYFALPLPEVVSTTGRYFANLTLPLALLTIGGTLSMKSLRDSSVMAAWATATKLLLLPLFLTLGAWLVGFRGQELTLMMVLFACPTAAASFVMAKAMGGNAQLAANIVLTTTLGSVITISSAIYLVRVFGVI